MIQRKQSIFLLLAIVIAIFQFLIPFQTFNYNNNSLSFYTLPGNDTEIMNVNLYILFVLNSCILILAGIVIFLFKKRTLQYKLANFGVLLNMLLMGLFFSLSFTKENLTGEINFKIGAFLPLINAFLYYLAAYFIKKDEELVRSADRIR